MTSLAVDLVGAARISSTIISSVRSSLKQGIIIDNSRTIFMSIKTPQAILRVYHRLFAYNFVRFALIGFTGFIVNYIVLILIFDLLGAPITVSQLIGAESALLTTFIGNNFWAFRDHHHIPIKHKLAKYHVTSGTGIVITSTIVVVLVKHMHVYYGLALAISACVGMVWNFLFNKFVIFRRHKHAELY
jgi:putative flippase GtrA